MIKLTLEKDLPVWINKNHIVAFIRYRVKEITDVMTIDKLTYVVIETPEEILKLMGQSNQLLTEDNQP